MTIQLASLVAGLNVPSTVLLFGAGSSVPSRAPTGAQLSSYLAKKFQIGDSALSLSETASLVEQRYSRRELVSEIRALLGPLKPTGGLMNIALYDWRSLYTTNFDNLVEQAYGHHDRPLTVYSSNFDFTIHESPVATKLFKLHGTLEKDVSDGHVSRLIVTDADFDQTAQYRDSLYDRLRSDLAGGHLVVIGHSLQDPDIREVAKRAAELGAQTHGVWKVTLLLFERDDERALLFEKRGFAVCFGGIDQFFLEMARKFSATPSTPTPGRNLPAILMPVTHDVEHASGGAANLSAMFNGWPATHADVLAGLTFERTIAGELATYLRSPSSLCAVLLGPSGTGKTTAARQTAQLLRAGGYRAWEHHPDVSLSVEPWVEVAKRLKADSEAGILIVDEAHGHLIQLNELSERLAGEDLFALKLLVVSTRNHWNPRVKSTVFFRLGKHFNLTRLQAAEIDALLNLVDASKAVRELVEESFSGFTRHERRRRLVERCHSEMFVCMKNIFASEKFDDIILREYASLTENFQEIYRYVAAMESAGIHVHRQLVIRLLGIPAESISAALGHLADIVEEYDISPKEGLFGWRCRHPVIASIVAKYKYSDPSKKADLFLKVVDNISPTYDLEVRTMRELCSAASGLESLPEKSVQNMILRRMMSALPGERVPRHRLIRNLIAMGEFEKADTELRIFEKDLGGDGPVARYRILLLIARSKKSPGIMEEDRVAILEQARSAAVLAVQRFATNKHVLSAYGEVGFELFKRTNDPSTFDEAIGLMRTAEEQVGDPDIGKIIAKLEARMLGVPDRPEQAEDL